ncbi:MAG: (deoxy)nucleoside triphosphate pyrophosphohydrolase [Planctomycetaceae bacterium]
MPESDDSTSRPLFTEAATLVQVGIAIVMRDGAVLVGERGPDVPLAGYAEFPGGKVEAGESPEECAVRECAEETGLLVRSVEPLLRQPWSYPHANVVLHFIRCELVEPLVDQLPTGNFRWRPAGELRRLRFPDANAAIVETIAAG